MQNVKNRLKPKKKQFKQLVRTKSGNYQIASGYWTFTVTAPDAYGNRQLYGERTDGQRITFSPVADHSIEGREDLASVYTALEALQTKAAAVNAENKPGKGVKKAKKPDLNRILDSDDSDRSFGSSAHTASILREFLQKSERDSLNFFFDLSVFDHTEGIQLSGDTLPGILYIALFRRPQ